MTHDLEKVHLIQVMIGIRYLRLRKNLMIFDQ